MKKTPSKTTDKRSFFATEAKWSTLIGYAIPLIGLLAIGLMSFILWLTR